MSARDATAAEVEEAIARGDVVEASYHGQVVSNLADERDRMRRLFNRLEAAVSHHKNGFSQGGAHDCDLALWKARDKILSDYAEGKG